MLGLARRCLPGILILIATRLAKSHICQVHDACVTTGLVDDDFGMELLVGGNIISLSLPVRLVWECVWRPSLPSAASEASGHHTLTHSCTLPCTHSFMHLLACSFSQCPTTHSLFQHSLRTQSLILPDTSV